ncbi:MAG: SDR family NAD(P)-dependent oxidoreductase [Alphaproteobacteria bacterium]|nr:SDR family NAD(P)-dependent oxidoreductase [Alphaproteobacteria bacterium]
MTSKVTFDLNGQTAFITGATSGFGLRFAEVLSDAGATVVITGRRIDRLQALKTKIESRGGRALPLALDVTQAAEIRACVAEAERLAGPISILVNNAGMNVQSSASTLGEADYDRLMDTNVKGAFFVAQAVGSRMVEQKLQGRIVNVASIGAFKALPGLVAYSMSKAAVAMMTKGLAREWAKYHVAVNALCPGFIETELNSEWFATEGGKKQVASFPRRRLGKEEDLDAMLLLLCSKHAGFITGSLFTLDDGQLLA